MTTGPEASGFGVYVHVPFCASRCDYCSFATYTDRDHLMVDYASACVAELRRARAEEDMPAATSVFVGGGTPSRLPGELLAEILSAVPRTSDAEVTAECNPEGASGRLFAQWRAAGVTRLSFGVQSMVPHVLVGLGRAHEPAAVGRAVRLAGDAGFASVNVDLIFGGAGETDDDWDATLSAALALEPVPEHVSAYALTVEPGTVLAAEPARHPDDDTQARRYERAEEVLCATGYRWYEVSNWARPGHRCRHNRLYWPRATTEASVRPPTRIARGAASGTSAPPTATSPPSAPVGRRSPGRRCSTRASVPSRRWPCRCARPRASRPTPCPTNPSFAGWSTCATGAPCSRCEGACWPTR